jgi:hypothetical protein
VTRGVSGEEKTASKGTYVSFIMVGRYESLRRERDRKRFGGGQLEKRCEVLNRVEESGAL